MTHNDSTTEQLQQQQQLDYEQQQRQRILANSSQQSNARTHTQYSVCMIRTAIAKCQ